MRPCFGHSSGCLKASQKLNWPLGHSERSVKTGLFFFVGLGGLPWRTRNGLIMLYTVKFSVLACRAVVFWILLCSFSVHSARSCHCRYFTIDFDSQIIFYSHSTSQKKVPTVVRACSDIQGGFDEENWQSAVYSVDNGMKICCHMSQTDNILHRRKKF